MTEATINKAGEKFFVGKGSFDTICAACNVPEEEAKAMLKLAEELSAKGLRVIAVAKGADRSRLEFVGLAGIADRIREDSREILRSDS